MKSKKENKIENLSSNSEVLVSLVTWYLRRLPLSPRHYDPPRCAWHSSPHNHFLWTCVRPHVTCRTALSRPQEILSSCSFAVLVPPLGHQRELVPSWLTPSSQGCSSGEGREHNETVMEEQNESNCNFKK